MKETVQNVVNETHGKKKTVYTWEARNSFECINGLITLCQEIKAELESRYNDIVPDVVKQMGKIFDFENMIEKLSKFSVQNGKLSISKADRREWETCGREEFNEFYIHVCNLPHIVNLSDMNPDLELFAHSSDLVLKNLKTTLQNIIWQGLGGSAYESFRDKDGKKDRGISSESIEEVLGFGRS